MGMMYGSGCFGSGGWFYGLVYFALAAFVFGIIFWWTYHLMNKKKR